jgi:hypothetical protein
VGTACSVRKFLVEKQISTVEHVLLSPASYCSEWILSSIHLFFSLVVWFIVTGKSYVEQETAGTATAEVAELQVQ